MLAVGLALGQGEPLSLGYLVREGHGGEGRVRKRKISPKVVELALTASHSKTSWDGARFGPQRGKELRPGLAKPGRVPRFHTCLPLPHPLYNYNL